MTNKQEPLSPKLKSLIWSIPRTTSVGSAASNSSDGGIIISHSHSHDPQQQPSIISSSTMNAEASPSYQPAVGGINNSNSVRLSIASNCSVAAADNFDYSHQPDPTHGTSNIVVATFNLVATIVGGGVLSLPFAFYQCGGALWGILWMVVAAVATDQSCLMLCWSARPHSYSVLWNTNNPDVTTSTTTTTTPQVLSSYGQVGKAAFGPIMEVCISALLFVFLVFVLIAYNVLVKDIWTPIILSLFLEATVDSVELEARDIHWGPTVLLGIVVLMSPFLVQHTLHALRYNCYIGFASVSVLCLALCYHALITNSTSATTITTSQYTTRPTTTAVTTIYNVLWTREFWLAPPPHSIQGVITAFPIIMLSYICHFNVNPIQKALMDPTPQRVTWVVHGAMIACGLLMTLFGVAGYAYVIGNTTAASGNANNNNTTTSHNTVYGNILLNCEEQQATLGRVDVLLTMGRIGCGITIMLAMAIMMLPCRDSLLEVLDSIVFAPMMLMNNNQKNNTTITSTPHSTAALMEGDNNQCPHSNSINNHYDEIHKSVPLPLTTSEETPLVDNTTWVTYAGSKDSTDNNANNTNSTSHNKAPPSLSDYPVVHYATTAFIVVVCYISAVKVPGVAIVWSLCGSSMAFGIAFVLPAACYLQILQQYQDMQQQQQQQQQPGDIPITTLFLNDDQVNKAPFSKLLAWFMLIVSIVAAIVCTTQTIQSMV